MKPEQIVKLAAIAQELRKSKDLDTVKLGNKINDIIWPALFDKMVDPTVSSEMREILDRITREVN